MTVLLKVNATVLASLPMYDWPEIRDATDAFWSALGRRLGVAGGLQHPHDHALLWREPQLLFSQTCGFPLTHEFRGILSYVATPHYAADGCQGPLYSSFIYARENRPLPEFRGRIAAINAADSMSGMLALKLIFAPFAQSGHFFGSVAVTGSHVNSLLALQEGKADVCAIDAVVVALARTHRPHLLEGLKMIAQSPCVPALPFVTRAGDPTILRSALQDVMRDGDLQSVRNILMLEGISVLNDNAYDTIADLERKMQENGGLRLPVLA